MFRRTLLAAEVVGLYVRTRWLVLRRGPIPAAAILRGGGSASRSLLAEPDRVRAGVRLGRAVIRVLRLLPGDSRCLTRSLVLTGLLARRGIPAKVVLGVRTAPSFAAHAWVEVDGQAVLPTSEPEYERLAEI